MELVGTHTQERGCERLPDSIGMDTRRSKSEREAKENLEKDGGEGKKQGGVDELGSSQTGGGTEQRVLVGKRDGLMRLLARRDMMMMMMMMMKTKMSLTSITNGEALCEIHRTSTSLFKCA